METEKYASTSKDKPMFSLFFFFWFIVHALLKWYGYLQYLQSPFQGALTHTQTHPHDIHTTAPCTNTSEM